MNKKCLPFIAIALLSPMCAIAVEVQSTSSVYLSFRHCVAGETVCDSIGRAEISVAGGLPGESAANANRTEPEFGEVNGSAHLKDSPGETQLIAEASSLPATRNGGNSFIVQRYTNASEGAEALTLTATFDYEQTVPAENAAFPPDGPSRSGAVAEMEFFTLDVDAIEAGTTAEDNWETMFQVPEADLGYASVVFTGSGPTSNVSESETKSFSIDTVVAAGDSIWIVVILQSLAANGAEVSASLATSLEVAPAN